MANKFDNDGDMTL